MHFVDSDSPVLGFAGPVSVAAAGYIVVGFFQVH
jgi:hypothetical protein